MSQEPERENSIPIMGICSPPRVNLIASKLGISKGMALGLTVNDEDGEPWDFNREENKQKT